MLSPATLHRVTRADDQLLRKIAGLLVAAVERHEAVGLTGPITSADYLAQLEVLLAEADRGDAGLVAAIDADGAAVGTAQWRRSPYPTRRVLAELDRVTVAPGHRGRGVGHALVEHVAADVAAHGGELLMLEVRGNNLGAIALYESCGFTRTGLLSNAVADGDARHDVVLMACELARPPAARLLGALPAGAGASLPRAVTEGLTWHRTQRLLLCRPGAADAAEHFAVHADPAANTHNPAGPQTDPAESEQLLATWAWHWARFGFGYWTVRLAETGEVLGFGGVRPRLPGEDGLNLYYRFRPSAWGNGYAQEVGRTALDLARRQAPGEPVVALIRPANLPSIRVAERLGMRLDGNVYRELGTYLRYVIRP